MNFAKDDFKRMQYNVYDLSHDTSVFDQWPELTRYKEYYAFDIGGISRDKLLRYIFFLYDKKTPLLSEKSLTKRKLMALELAGFEKKEGEEYPAAIQAILVNENKPVSKMIVRFVRNQGDMRFALLVAGMETYYENMMQITNSHKDDDVLDSAEKSKLFEQSRKMSNDLEALADELFLGDVELAKEADEVNQEDKEFITSWPEYWAKKHGKN